jgi:hypothetical protein
MIGRAIISPFKYLGAKKSSPKRAFDLAVSRQLLLKITSG